MSRHDHAEPPASHAVAVYDSDRELVAEVATYLAEGLLTGESAIAVVTSSHRAAVEAAVECTAGATPTRDGSRYILLDAAQTLAEFSVNGRPDSDRFEVIVGGVIDAAARGGTPVRVFGEMVALLWDTGQVASAIDLESFWNALAASRDFSLLCAYSAASLDSGSLSEATAMCHLHSSVHTLGGQTAAAATISSNHDLYTSELLVPSPTSVSRARHFTAFAVGSWAEQQVVEDVSLIASELAANAVRHAASAFRVHVAHLGPRVRVTVEDSGPGSPQLSSAGPFDPSGRGLALTELLSSTWGWHAIPDGKAVWAELSTESL